MTSKHERSDKMPRVNQSVETSVIDEKGNLISKRANKTLSWGAEPPYIKIYLQDILYLSDLPRSHENILFELLKRATYAGDEYGMTVTLSSGMKKIMAKTLNIKNVRSINNALTDLVKGEVLSRIETGVYQFNPYLFGKGDWQDIDRLRLEINYDLIKGKTFRTVCDYKDNHKNEHPMEQKEECMQGQMEIKDTDMNIA